MTNTVPKSNIFSMFESFEDSNFEFVSDFDIRISDLSSLPNRLQQQSLFNSHRLRTGELAMG